MNKGTLLWLDDIRDPLTQNWLTFSPISPDKVVWVKSYYEFINWIAENGLPDAICFDHDLCEQHIADFYEQKNNNPNELIHPRYELFTEKTGYDCAKWLIEYCIDNNLKLPLYNIQSANFVGKENIMGLLEGFRKYGTI